MTRPVRPIPGSKQKLRLDKFVGRRHHLPQARRHHRRAVRGQEDRRRASRAGRWSSTCGDRAHLARSASASGSTSSPPCRRKVTSLWFVECAPKVVDQFNMVANFGGTGQPGLLLRALSLRLLRRRSPPAGAGGAGLGSSSRPASCPSASASRAATPSTSTKIRSPSSRSCSRIRRCEVPPDVAAFLASRLNYAVADGARKLKIEKQIDGRATYLKLSGDLDGSFPREKIADGARGRRHLRSAAASARSIPPGAAEWRQMMPQIAAPSERILIVGARRRSSSG